MFQNRFWYKSEKLDEKSNPIKSYQQKINRGRSNGPPQG